MKKMTHTTLVDSSKSEVSWNEPEGFHLSGGGQARLTITSISCYSVGGGGSTAIPAVLLNLYVTAKTDSSQGFATLHLTSRSARQLARELELAANDFDEAILEL